LLEKASGSLLLLQKKGVKNMNSQLPSEDVAQDSHFQASSDHLTGNSLPGLQLTSSYRKSYIAWDHLERANKPQNCSAKTKYLSKNSQALLAIISQKLQKKNKLFLNHKYISKITRCERRQNQNIIKELYEILNVNYHHCIIEDGKKYRFCYEFSFKKSEKEKPVNSGDWNGETGQKISRSNIYRKNKIFKNRFNRSNDRNDFLGEEKTDTSQIAKTSSNSPVPTEADEAKAPIKHRSRAKSLSVEPKFLADFYPANEQTCELLRERSGRDFSNRFINQLLLALSKKPSRAVFYHFNGFLSYFAKVLSYEKRDATRCSSVDFYLKANMTDALKEELTQKKAQESYLLAIEESKATDATSHMRKKIAQSWPRLVAYEFLQSWQSLSLQNNGELTLRLNSPVFLSEHQQERLQELAREAYSLFPDGSAEFVVTCKLEVQESPRESKGVQKTQREEAPSACTTTARAESAKDPLSEQFQAKITQLLGSHIAKHWFKACHLVLDERGMAIRLPCC